MILPQKWNRMVCTKTNINFLLAPTVKHAFCCDIIHVQWNPALQTLLKSHLRYCGHFVWSRMHFTHACGQSKLGTPRTPLCRRLSGVPTIPELYKIHSIIQTLIYMYHFVNSCATFSELLIVLTFLNLIWQTVRSENVAHQPKYTCHTHQK